MSFETFVSTLRQTPEAIDFEDTMAVIESQYEFTPTAFTNGDVNNEVGENNGSCKIFAFGLMNSLTESETLACFGRFYRNDVLENPEGSDHQNIRNFMQSGWSGVSFTAQALSAKA